MTTKLNEENASFLGINPTCDVCGKYIRVGESVKQVITGMVKIDNETTELLIDEEYELLHTTCDPFSSASEK